jgi:hypothetical protein
MTTPTNPINRFTPFLPSTYNLPEEQDRWKEWLGSNLSDVSDCVNDKKIGAYTQDAESFNGEKWIYDTVKLTRTGYQFILRIKSFPNTGNLVLLLPFPFTNQFSVTHVWGSASKPPTTPGTGEYFSFYSEGNSRITFVMTDTNVTITTTADMTKFSGYIIVEYLKDGI